MERDVAPGDEGAGGDDRRRRLEALRTLAAGTPSQPAPEEAPAGSGTVPVRPTRRRRWPCWVIPAVCVVALLAVVAAIAVRFLPSHAPGARAISANLAIDPTVYGISCLEFAAWSPDSTKLAIMGQQQACGTPDPNNYSYYPTIIAVINPLTGKQLAQIYPDATVQRDLHLHAPQYITPVNGPSDSGDLTQQGAVYQGMIWSPDSKRIALPFGVDYATQPLGAAANALTQLFGVYVVDANGSNDHAAAYTEDATWVQIDEWNMKTLKPAVFTPPADAITRQGSPRFYPASLSYSWRSDGTLAGATPLYPTSAPPAPPLGPVGNPDGGASFTIWQPGFVGLDEGKDFQNPVYPAQFEWSPGQVIAWSPDGTYLLNADMTPLRLQPSKQPAPATALISANEYPVAPMRDKALDGILNAMNTTSYTRDRGRAFSWRPDGMRVAVAVQDNTSGAVTVTILDCATGAMLGLAHVTGNANTYQGIAGAGMIWAPDGQQLLVQSNAELFLLGPGAFTK